MILGGKNTIQRKLTLNLDFGKKLTILSQKLLYCIFARTVYKILPNSVYRYVYGARSTAAKTRRCGECEGCNREDCGKCVTCLDKPKFGGRCILAETNNNYIWFLHFGSIIDKNISIITYR